MSDEQRKSLLRRAGSYGGSKIRPQAVRDASRQSLSTGGRAALDALRPESIDLDEARDAISGRYADGGKARFREMMEEEGLSAEDLDAIRETHQRNFRLYLGLSSLFLLGAVVMAFLSSGAMAIIAALLPVLFAIGAAIRAIQSDFSAFQIEKRAFCGLRRYLRERFF